MGGGFSGLALNHSDIGGYTSLSKWGLGYSREQELLLRWMEASAFTTAFRTHEGNQPGENAQFYSNSTTLDAFSKFAKVYAALGFYRAQLFKEASEKGYPVVRHLVLEFQNDNDVAELTDQFMLGDEFLVAPIINKNRRWKKVYFPEGTWINVWTGKKYGDQGNNTNPWWSWMNRATGRYAWVPAPLGQPPVFYRQGSAVGAQFEANLNAYGVK